ncbi:hypothetical protein [Pyxidicoccus xibeiensis]|nr:hypothetical protein [Pyxidicoccus xibeiensis]
MGRVLESIARLFEAVGVVGVCGLVVLVVFVAVMVNQVRGE